MNLLGSSAGIWMLLALGVLTVTTGLPVWALLIGVASAFAVAGLAAGVIDLNILSALPSRLVGLLEHDLLQALPLYVLVGVLLQRLPIADAIFTSLARLLRPLGAAPSLAALGVGALVAPMNGSVASSSALLSRLVGARLAHLAPSRAISLGAVAATIGVVVPPSLVLILLGDAMLRAHTEASNLPGFKLGTQRIINTQDVFHAALLPALGVLALWGMVAWWQGRGQVVGAPAQGAPAQGAQACPSPQPSPQRGEGASALLALAATAVILGLLAGVFTGKLFAVEAAATGGCLLVLGALASRSLSWPQWRGVMADTLALSGALIALLAGATVFSLVLRLFGTDRLLAETLLSTTLPPQLAALLVLLLVTLCAWVLDAFEMIFVVIPIVAPPLVAMLGDAQQAAVLLLLVLQLSFLIPPMGYAILMARARAASEPVALRQTLWQIFPALLPYILAQLALACVVFLVPQSVHLLDGPQPTAQESAPASQQDIEKQMREMAAPRDAPAESAAELPAGGEPDGSVRNGPAK
ncbi:MAG: TRAP transporter large permease subunit [Bdellovibrionales bacterium]|nr:TRAP transporter large permease subunit [Ramlibacter sp.]